MGPRDLGGEIRLNVVVFVDLELARPHLDALGRSKRPRAVESPHESRDAETLLPISLRH